MCEVKKHITDEELNSYRFLSGEEPSEELLEAIMCEVAAEAKERNERATEQYFNQMKRNIIEKQQYWASRFETLQYEQICPSSLGASITTVILFLFYIGSA